MDFIDIFDFSKYFKRVNDRKTAKVGHVNEVIEKITELEETVTNSSNRTTLIVDISSTEILNLNTNPIELIPTLNANQYLVFDYTIEFFGGSSIEPRNIVFSGLDFSFGIGGNHLRLSGDQTHLFAYGDVLIFDDGNTTEEILITGGVTYYPDGAVNGVPVDTTAIIFPQGSTYPTIFTLTGIKRKFGPYDSWNYLRLNNMPISNLGAFTYTANSNFVFKGSNIVTELDSQDEIVPKKMTLSVGAELLTDNNFNYGNGSIRVILEYEIKTFEA